MELARSTEGCFLIYDGKFAHALEHQPCSLRATLRYQASEVVIIPSTSDLTSWGKRDQSGICATVNLGAYCAAGVLAENDYACLDVSNADNINTFPNPNTGAFC